MASLRRVKTGTTRQCLITGVAILIGVPCFLMAVSCGTPSNPVVSKPPIVSTFDSHPLVAVYVQEFRQGAETYYWAPISPDQKWELYIERENTEALPGGFFSLRLRDKTPGDSRILFTLWDADVDSGVRAYARWSKDGKALEIKGDTRGFIYSPRPDAMKYESFHFIYLIDEDKMYSIPTEGA